jgi:hypothetical protein
VFKKVRIRNAEKRIASKLSSFRLTDFIKVSGVWEWLVATIILICQTESIAVKNRSHLLTLSPSQFLSFCQLSPVVMSLFADS